MRTRRARKEYMSKYMYIYLYIYEGKQNEDKLLQQAFSVMAIICQYHPETSNKIPKFQLTHRYPPPPPAPLARQLFIYL